tara:strand:+ start:9112 stop:9432 length:321 start_codon:yes stop_codon:yes gene_type:complete
MEELNLISIFAGFFITLCFYVLIINSVNEDNFKIIFIKKFINYFFLLLLVISLIVFARIIYIEGWFSILRALISALLILFFPTGIYFGILKGKWNYIYLNILEFLN